MRRALLAVRLSTFLLVSMLLPVAAAPAEEEVVYVLHGESGTMSVVDPTQGRLEGTVELSLPHPQGLHPTPGGKYVFVGFADSPALAVVDVETHEEVDTVELTGATPVDMAFSPMGGSVYIAFEGSDKLGVYTHARGRLTPEDSFAFGTPSAPVLLNRRGTRFYRSDSGSLRIGYVKTRETIATVDHPGDDTSYAFAPDFRFVWGLSRNGNVLVVLDERRERVVETIRGSFSGGHIPGSVHAEWVLNVDDPEAGTFLPKDELREMYDTMGVTDNVQVVTLCQTGVRGSHTYFVLRLLGYENVRLYDGSWAEWGNDPDTPIVTPEGN